MNRILSFFLTCFLSPVWLLAQDLSVRQLRALPPGAISTGSPFVLAAGGESYLFNPPLGIVKAPFLTGVYKPFGFSPDQTEFLYLKSNGKLPGFSLYAFRFSDATDRLIASGVVEKAMWSPDGSRIAYMTMESLTQHRLLLTPSSGGPAELLSSGRLDSEFMEFSPDGSRIAFRSLNPFPDHTFEKPHHQSIIHEMDLSTNEIRGVAGALWAGYEDGNLRIALDRNGVSERLFTAASIAPWKDSDVARFRTTPHGTFTGRVTNGVQVVERYIPGGRFESIALGTIEYATPDGLVIRNFLPTGVEYKFYSYASKATTELFAFHSFFRLPFSGTGQLLQGGSGGGCDSGCATSSHFAQLAFASDWKIGSFVLAVEEGTVAAVVSDQVCNSLATGCADYRSNCAGDGAGNYVFIAHSDGSYSMYAHLAAGSVSVSVGGQICQGGSVGRQGHTGSTGSGADCGDHVHYQRTGGVGSPWGQSIATDFIETPCTFSCGAFYTSTNGSAGCNGKVQYDLSTNPFGLNLRVDGSTAPAPRSFTWDENTQHSLEAVAPQSVNGSQTTRYQFSSWSDGGSQSRTVNVGSTYPSLTATYQLQWKVTASVAQPSLGSITIDPPGDDGFYPAGSIVLITAVPAPGYRFKNWSGDSNITDPALSVSLTRPVSYIANFEVKPITDYTISTSPAGLKILVDGVVMTAPQTFQWKENDTHTVSGVSPQLVGSTEHAFSSWSDGGVALRSIKVGQPPAAVVANFTQRHKLTFLIDPPGSGSVSTLPGSPDGFYAAGSSVQLTPVPSPGKRIASWSGDLVSLASNPTVVMSKPLTITATFEDGPTIGTGGVVNGADYSPRLAPGGIMSIYGTNLAVTSKVATQLPLPASLDGTSVDVIDGNQTFPAYLFSVSQFQVNALMPFEVTGNSVDVVIKTAQGTFTVKGVPVIQQAPALFTFDSSGIGQAIVVHADYTLVTATAPATGGESVFLYAVGLGKTNPPKQRGEPGGDGAALGPLNRVDDAVTVTVGGKPVTAFFAGLAPGFAGVYQVNFTLPAGLTPGNQLITISINNRGSGPNVVVPYRP
jgi:uncharacterized protein (TIGR03437 family)